MSVPAAHPHEAGRLLITELRYRLFAASRALLESALRGSEQQRRGYAPRFRVPPFTELTHPSLEHLIGMEACVLA
jgi:hypothetical protein